MTTLVERKRSKWEPPESDELDLVVEVKRIAQRYWGVVAAVVAGLVLILGLANALTRERPGEVSGVVTYGGRPIPWGRITFVGESGTRQAVSGTIKNGAFTVRGCLAGPARVSVESLRAVRARTSEAPRPGITKGFRVPPPADAPPPEVIGQHLAIPPEYGNADTSGLRYEVRQGRQTHDISLPRRQ